jgi:hypothetical protein
VSETGGSICGDLVVLSTTAMELVGLDLRGQTAFLFGSCGGAALNRSAHVGLRMPSGQPIVDAYDGFPTTVSALSSTAGLRLRREWLLDDQERQRQDDRLDHGENEDRVTTVFRHPGDDAGDEPGRPDR